MTEGRFEKGRWVEEPETSASSGDLNDDLHERIASAKVSFGKGLDDILSVGRELVTTDEGRRHIGKAMDKAGGEIMSALEEAARSASEYINSILEQKEKK
jgi:hypothetical protein